MSKKIVLTGGGTGGHVTPNLALIPYLQKAGFEISYLGSPDGIERELIEPLGIPYYCVDSERLNRYFTAENLTMPFHVLKGLRQARKWLKEIRPDILFSKGGFVSVPIVFEAHALHIPIVNHESDITPGLANKLAGPLADRTCVNFEEALACIPDGKGVCTGTPIRDSLLTGDKTVGLELSGLSGQKPILLVMGGSTGAQALNDAIRQALDAVLPRFDVIHLCGRGHLDATLCGRAGYFQIEYADQEMPHFYAACDVTMCRAGANTLAEILALRLPNVLVPLPLDASRGDQILNAQSFTKKGYSFTLEQEKMTTQTILTSISEVYDNREKYVAAMAKGDERSGSERVLAVIEEVLAQKKGSHTA